MAKVRDWRAEPGPHPLMPEGAICPKGKTTMEGGKRLTFGSCSKCKFLIGPGWYILNELAVRCNHKGQPAALRARIEEVRNEGATLA